MRGGVPAITLPAGESMVLRGDEPDRRAVEIGPVVSSLVLVPQPGYLGSSFIGGTLIACGCQSAVLSA